MVSYNFRSASKLNFSTIQESIPGFVYTKNVQFVLLFTKPPVKNIKTFRFWNSFNIQSPRENPSVTSRDKKKHHFYENENSNTGKGINCGFKIELTIATLNNAMYNLCGIIYTSKTFRILGVAQPPDDSIDRK